MPSAIVVLRQRAHEAKVHVKLSTDLRRTYGQFACVLFLYASLLFPINMPKWMVFEFRRDSRYFARHKIELILTRGTKSQHPQFGLRESTWRYRYIVFMLPCDRQRRHDRSADYWSITPNRVPSYRECIRGTIIQSISIVQGQ